MTVVNLGPKGFPGYIMATCKSWTGTHGAPFAPRRLNRVPEGSPRAKFSSDSRPKKLLYFSSPAF